METRAPNAHDLPSVLERADSVARSVLAPRAEAVDQEARWPEDSIRALQGAGLGGLVAPVEAGGLGLGLLGLAQVCERIAQECASTALCFGMHCVATAVIAAKATADQRARLLEPIARGEHLSTLALSEPGSGSHFYIPQTTLREVAPGEFRVSGTKTFVTSGSHADSYVVSTVAADQAAPPGQFSLVVVRNDAPGLTWGEPWRGLGMRGNDARTLTLDDTPVLRADMLGAEGDELWYVFRVVLPYFLVAMGGTYLGVANAALEEARAHLVDRRFSHSGATLAEQPVLQHRLGELWAETERARRLLYHAASTADVDESLALPAVLSSKAEVSEMAVRVVNEAMNLCGGIGYREHGRLGRLLRDARAGPVMSPTTDLLRTWTGRLLLGQPLLGD